MLFGMEILPIKTRALRPPQDSLYDAIKESDFAPKERDVVVVSAKVVSIDEGRTRAMIDRDAKKALAFDEADMVLPSLGTDVDRYVIHHAFIGFAGLDESNANGHLVLLPKDPCASAARLHAFIREKYSIQELAVVVVDSHSTPMRRGAMGIAIGIFGFEPVVDCRGEKDIFGREFRFESSNIADGLAAAGVLAMGETNQQTPLALIRGVQGITFVDHHTQDELFVGPEEDWFGELYQNRLK